MRNHDIFDPQPEPTGRRGFLKFLTHGLSALFGATLGVPALAFFLDPRNRPAPAGDLKAIANLKDLKEGVPTSFVISEVRRDAWTLHPNDIVGQVWAIRKGNEVTAFTATCPHLGCPVNWEGDKFICPCHNGTFKIDGSLADPGAGRKNPAPRGMDSLECQVKDGVVYVKFEQFEQAKPEKTVRA